MPRTERLEYPDAFYHVMNRGRGRQTIFHDRKYYEAFLETMQEAHERFEAVYHAYCLMGNHYHLLLQTPRANLSRIMRHINGVYTQRYNRLRKTDGPLFRGRFKAIVVDADAYLLQLSRYIHRNPIELKTPLVKRLELYQWSSYSSYVGKANKGVALKKDLIYEMVKARNPTAAYRQYVERSVDEEIQQFYGKKVLPSVLGDKSFIKQVWRKINEQKHKVKATTLQKIPIDEIVEAVCHISGKSKAEIVKRQSGRQQRNIPRKMAMYLGQHIGDAKLEQLKEYFGVNHVGSVSHAIQEMKLLLEEDKKVKRLHQQIIDDMNIIQET